jgi:hypothetical protein
MKKTLALLLALIMILSVALVACDKNSGTSGTTGDDEGGSIVNKNNKKEDEEDEGNGDDSGNTPTEAWTTFTTPKTMYCMADGVRVRTSTNYNGDGNILTAINAGESITATAKSNDAEEPWYKVTVNGQDAYILAEYLTEVEAETKFVNLPTPEVLTFKANTASKTYNTNLREAPAFGNQTTFITLNSATIKGTLVKVAVNEAGNIWKVEYTETGKATKTYYIGNKAFGNFVGYNDVSGGLG